MGQDKRPLGSENKTKSIESENVDSNPVVTETVVQKPVKPVKPRHSKAFSFVSMLFLLTLLATGVMAYFWYETDRDLQSAESDRDNAVKQLAQSDFELKNAISDADGTGSTGEQLSKDEMLVKTVNAYEKAIGATEFAFTKDSKVSKSGDFVGFGLREAFCVYKYQDGVWLQAYCSQGVNDRTDDIRQTWGIPDAVLNPPAES